MSLRRTWHDVTIWDVVDVTDYALLTLFVVLVTIAAFGRGAWR